MDGLGRVRSVRRHGSYFLFVDIVNQFHSIQAMINWANLSQNSGMTKRQFKLFVKMIEKGDHICTHIYSPCTTS